MENDLVSIYESNYLRGNLVQEKNNDLNHDGEENSEDFLMARDRAIKKAMGHKADEDEDEDKPTEESVKRKTKKSKKKSMKNKKEPNPGKIYGDSFTRSGNIFEQILREMDEMNGGMTGRPAEDNVFNADDQAEDMGGEEESFTLSELRAMTLGELVNLLADEGEDEMDGEMDGEGEDFIPAESYGFTGGEGNYKGDQGNYDGKAQRAKPTTLVKGNGDANFGDQDTGYDPDDTEGSEGSYFGDQGDYDGKAKKQAPTDFVKGNGDTNFSKANTGIKTSSGKKPKNYF